MPNQQSSKPKNTICRYKSSISGQRTTTAGSGQGLTPSLDQTKVEPEANNNASDSNQSKADQMEEEIKNMALIGPTYGEVDTFAIGNAKERAWENFMKKDGKNINQASASYMKAIKSIEKDAMECYESSIAEKLKLGKFRLMMARDGCFFLHWAIYILGGRELLHYPEQDPYFGKEIDSSSWIPDMFFVGNQIPCIVINALMEQPFFKNVIEEGIKKDTWKRPVEDLAKLALYQMIVEPHLEKNKINVSLLRKQLPPKDPPSDILEALRNLYLGSGSDNDPIYSEMKEFHDLEAGTNVTDIPIPGAGELYKQGIKLVKGKRGITNIRFENWGYSAFLYVPPFTVDDNTEKLLTSLANRELQLNESQRELTSYLRFMRDLTRTYKDFKILERKRIICVKDEKLKGAMVHMLDTIVSRHNSIYTLNFRQIRRKINDYGGPPWRFISFCLGVFTVVQTIFTVLSYCFPPRT